MQKEKNTEEALKWIVGILNKHNIPYRIGGGFAANFYGSNREINDIDFSLSGEYFSEIVSETKEYIVAQIFEDYKLVAVNLENADNYLYEYLKGNLSFEDMEKFMISDSKEMSEIIERISKNINTLNSLKDEGIPTKG